MEEGVTVSWGTQTTSTNNDEHSIADSEDLESYVPSPFFRGTHTTSTNNNEDSIADPENLESYAPWGYTSSPNGLSGTSISNLIELPTIKIRGDGNCLARALAHLTYGDQEHFMDIKHAIAGQLDIIFNGADEDEKLLYNDPKRIVSNMKETARGSNESEADFLKRLILEGGVWLGEEVISLWAQAYKKRIMLF